MKKHMSRNTLVMVLLDIVLGVVLSLYIANTGTMPAADNAATYTDGTYTASAKGCLSDHLKFFHPLFTSRRTSFSISSIGTDW